MTKEQFENLLDAEIMLRRAVNIKQVNHADVGGEKVSRSLHKRFGDICEVDGCFGGIAVFSSGNRVLEFYDIPPGGVLEIGIEL